jgi:AAA+ ATPase superfamily predicted ATPase
MSEKAFHNRRRELDDLERAIQSSRSELFILYGRRGVGKSALLSHATSGLRHVFYRATRRTLPLQLESLTDMTREAYPEEFLPQTFSSVDAFLQFLVHVTGRQPEETVITVIDELPYLAEVDRGFLTVLQNWWDAHKGRPNLKLFLAGSYVSFMERQVLSVNAPLYNRRTGSLRLDPFSYDEAALFFPAYSPRQRIEAYAILGGMPSYLEQFDPARGLHDNLLATVLRRGTYLNEEPNWLLLEDLRSDVLYGSILRAIATGDRKPSDIARTIGRGAAQDIAPHLETLRDLGLVERVTPITVRERSGRRSQYWLADNYLAFWYRYVDGNRSLVAQGLENRILHRIVRTFDEYVARPAFERVCRQFLWNAYRRDALPARLDFDAIGTWWGTDEEIDVVAMEGSTTTLAGTCKWTNAPMDVRDLRALQRAVDAGEAELQPVPDCWWALFSRSGFHEGLQAMAREPESHILLYRPEDLFADAAP